jgi:putative DNA primase/helicase
MTGIPSSLADLDEPRVADPLPDEPMTELGYARRLIEVYGSKLRFVVAWNRWLIWDGARWGPDTDGQVQRWMKVIARTVTSAVLLDQGDKDMLRAAKRAESNAGVKGALNLASTEPELAISPDDLDADPYLLNCRNGTIDLRTGERLEHDPALLLTKMAGAG